MTPNPQNAQDGNTTRGDGLAETLSRGIQVLKLVAAAPHPLSPVAIAGEVGVSRATAYRLLRTLEYHDLVAATPDGRYARGPGLGPLAAATQRSLRQIAAPTLRALADRTGLTAFIAMEDDKECVTLLSATPEGFTTSISQPTGSRHPISSGAPGKAILSIVPRKDWPLSQAQADSLEEEIEHVWQRGFAVSHNEVLPGVSSVSVPFQIPGERPCALALLCTDQAHDPAELASDLKHAAAEIEGRA